MHAELPAIALTPLSRRSLIAHSVTLNSHSHTLRLFTEGPRHGINTITSRWFWLRFNRLGERVADMQIHCVPLS